MKRSAWSTMLFAACALQSRLLGADVITLKDGRSFEGNVIDTSENFVEFITDAGTGLLDRKNVASIKFKPTEKQRRSYSERLTTLDKTSANAQFELGLFAAENRMDSEAVGHFLEALRIDPKFPRAARELEARLWRVEDGKWQDPADWYPAHGYLKFEDSWVTPKRYALLLAQEECRRMRDALRIEMMSLRALDRKIRGCESREAEEWDAQLARISEQAEARLKAQSLTEQLFASEQEVARATRSLAIAGEAEQKYGKSKALAVSVAKAQGALSVSRLNVEARRARVAEAEEIVASFDDGIAAGKAEIAVLMKHTESARQAIEAAEKLSSSIAQAADLAELRRQKAAIAADEEEAAERNKSRK